MLTVGGYVSHALEGKILAKVGSRPGPLSDSEQSRLYWHRHLTDRSQGKGYPDLATRSFLHQIYSLRPRMPMYALVDYDPDGVNIFRCYKWGSTALEHEEAARLLSLRWLGIRSHDLHDILGQGWTAPPIDRGVGTTMMPSSPEPASYSVASLDRLSRLTQRDRKLAVKLLGDLTNENSHDADAAEACIELQKMLMTNVKAEIQALNDDGDVARYLERKLVAGSL